MSSGNVVQIIGAVVDVEFPSDAMPKIYDALMVSEVGLTLEVQQQLGDGVVFCLILLDTLDNLVRFALLGEHFTDYQKGIGQGCVTVFECSFQFVCSHIPSIYPPSSLS